MSGTHDCTGVARGVKERDVGAGKWMPPPVAANNRRNRIYPLRRVPGHASKAVWHEDHHDSKEKRESRRVQRLPGREVRALTRIQLYSDFDWQAANASIK